jgi:hypothetical protein
MFAKPNASFLSNGIFSQHCFIAGKPISLHWKQMMPDMVTFRVLSIAIVEFFLHLD